MKVPWWFPVVCLALTACASAKPELRGPNEVERAQIDQALAPLVAASGICQGQERCPIGVGVIHLRRIDMAVGPHPPNKFGLTITSGALRNLQPSELQAALAHELGHVQLGHFDTRGERRQAEPPGAAKTAGNDEALRRNRAFDREEEFAADRQAHKRFDRQPRRQRRGNAALSIHLERQYANKQEQRWYPWLNNQ